MLILLVATAAAFSCPVPLHADGATLQCADRKLALRLDGIKVAPAFDSCKAWELCRTDPGTASRDHLAELTRGASPSCRKVDGGSVRCTVRGRDLSCAMVADGHALALPSLKDCPPAPPAPSLLERTPDIPVWLVAAAVGFVNLAAMLAVAFDHYRSRRGFGGFPERLLLLLAMMGGGLGLVAAEYAFRDDGAARGQSPMVFVILGLQIGAIVGILLL